MPWAGARQAIRTLLLPIALGVFAGAQEVRVGRARDARFHAAAGQARSRFAAPRNPIMRV